MKISLGTSLLGGKNTDLLQGHHTEIPGGMG